MGQTVGLNADQAVRLLCWRMRVSTGLYARRGNKHKRPRRARPQRRVIFRQIGEKRMVARRRRSF